MVVHTRANGVDLSGCPNIGQMTRDPRRMARMIMYGKRVFSCWAD